MPHENKAAEPQKKEFQEPKLREESSLTTLTQVPAVSGGAGDDGGDSGDNIEF